MKQTEMNNLEKVLNDVTRERLRQNTKWGQQNLTPHQWLSVLTEEVGEAAQEANRATWWKTLDRHRQAIDDLRTEMVHVAAVAVAAIECLDRHDADMDTCQTCGSRVHVVGNVTMHYEPVHDPVLQAESLQLTAENEQLREEITRLNEKLAVAHLREDRAYVRGHKDGYGVAMTPPQEMMQLLGLEPKELP